MQKIIILVSVFFTAVAPAYAASLYDIEMPDTMVIEGTTLVLNGQGVRKVEKFGIPFKVYVGGLYLGKKSHDPSEIHKMAEVKLVDMTFLRRVSTEDLAKGFLESYRNNCFPEDCEASLVQVKEFAGKLVDMLNKSTMRLQFFADRVEVTIHGRKDAKFSVNGAAFSRNLLNAYIGPKPANKELKSGLLGLGI